jgi:hypothetical protein
MRHFNYKDYYLELFEAIDESDSLLSEEKKMPLEFKNLFRNRIKNLTKQSWKDAKNSERESYMLSDDELEKAWEDSMIEYTSNIVRNLSDKELIEMSIREDGEIVYSLSEKGKQALEYKKNGYL